MDRNGFIPIIFVFLFVFVSVSTTCNCNCNASLVFHVRKLIATEGNNASATSQVPPIASPVNDSNTNTNTNTNTSSINTEKPQIEKQKESQTGNQTNNTTTVPLPVDTSKSNKSDNDTKSLGAPIPLSPAAEKKGSGIDVGSEKGNTDTSVPKPIDDGSCNGSVSTCSDQGMRACIQAPKDGSKDVFLVVINEGEVTMKVNVKVPNSLENILVDVEVPKDTSKKIDISSYVGNGKSNNVIVSSGGAVCELALAQSVSVDKILQQLSFYYKQVTPIYALYASFLVTLLLGGTWACCRLSKRNKKDEVPYQELEMGIPESASATNVDGSEGWDHDWDEDWDEDIEVKSPSGHQIRSVSADGLTARSPPKKDGWENGWED